MGVVFQAHDPGMGRDVAIKVLRLDPTLNQAERDEISRRFEGEARAAGGLNHPNIVAHYERGEIDGHRYIVMELVEGPALHQMMSQEQRPNAEHCLLCCVRSPLPSITRTHVEWYTGISSRRISSCSTGTSPRWRTLASPNVPCLPEWRRPR